MLLPAFLTLLLLALQPVCILYTRAVMESAAAEAARLMVTAELEGEDAYRAFVERRLAAVPNVSIFHAGGPRAWKVEFARAEETGGAVSASITGSVRPLPVIGAFARAMGRVDGEGAIELEVEASYEGRPSWLEGGYDDWIGQWE